MIANKDGMCENGIEKLNADGSDGRDIEILYSFIRDMDRNIDRLSGNTWDVRHSVIELGDEVKKQGHMLKAMSACCISLAAISAAALIMRKIRR